MNNVICIICRQPFRGDIHKVCPCCYEGHCFGCGIAPGDGYTEGCDDCDESRDVLSYVQEQDAAAW